MIKNVNVIRRRGWEMLESRAQRIRRDGPSGEEAVEAS